MRVATLTAILLLVPSLAFAGGNTSLSGMTGGSLSSPSYHSLGQTSSNRITTISPHRVLRPSGGLDAESHDVTPGGRMRGDDQLLLERHLDCFSGAVTPDRDTRNSFMSRCPGNTR